MSDTIPSFNPEEIVESRFGHDNDISILQEEMDNLMLANSALNELKNQSTVEDSAENLGDQEQEQEYVDLRKYQQQIYKMIEQQWFVESSGYGSIIFMATASGKTYVAIMLILRVFGLPVQLKKLTDEQIRGKQELINKACRADGKKVAFMVPTTNLVEQQADTINQSTDLLVSKLSGNHQKSMKSMSGE